MPSSRLAETPEPVLLRLLNLSSTKHPSYRTPTCSIPSPRPSLGGVLTSTGVSRCFDTVCPPEVSPGDGLRRFEAMGICISAGRGAHEMVVKGDALSVGNRAFLLINPPAIGEIRSALPRPRNPRERCRLLAPREPLFLLRSSAMAGLVHPA